MLASTSDSLPAASVLSDQKFIWLGNRRNPQERKGKRFQPKKPCLTTDKESVFNKI